jgi:hypothetical protein
MDEFIAAVIRDLERRRVGALVARDIVFVRSLQADDYELISGGGGRLSNETYLGGIESDGSA